MKEFESPQLAVGDLSAELMDKLLALSADVRFIVDDEGVVREMADVGGSLLHESPGRWLGKPWVDVVRAGDRSKVEALLREARAGASAPWRCIEHLSCDGADLPLSCAAIALPPADDSDTGAGRWMVLARDLAANLSPATMRALALQLHQALAPADTMFELGIVSTALVPVQFVALPGPPRAQQGTQLMISFWAWGDDDLAVFANLDRLLRNVADALAKIAQVQNPLASARAAT